MFLMEMVEGKDNLPQVPEKWSELGRTTGPLMPLLQSYFTTEKCLA
jgi:hypothetical protein